MAARRASLLALLVLAAPARAQVLPGATADAAAPAAPVTVAPVTVAPAAPVPTPAAPAGVAPAPDAVPGARWSYADSRGRPVALPLPRLRALAGGPEEALFDTGDPRRPLRLRDGLLVALEAPARTFPRDLARSAGLAPDRPLDRARTTWRCRAGGPEAVLRASRELAGRPGVRWALPDFAVAVDLHGAPADPYYPDQWGLRPGAAGSVDAEGAWAVTSGDPRVVVAIVDTGVDVLHPDLASPGRFVPGRDALEDDGDPWPGPLAAGAHGTHSAGIVGALHNDRGVAGLCPACRLMGLRFLTGLPGDEHVAELSNAAEALHFAADQGAWVINNSWGVYDVNKPKVDLQPLYEAARHAATRGGPDGTGALVVFSAGNDGGAIEADDLAALPEVLSVGAVDPDGRRQDYSQTGPALDLAAPGGAWWWKDPQAVTLDTAGSEGGTGHGANKGTGWHYASALLVEARKDWPEPDGTGEATHYFNGTSSAAPVVSGVAALAWSAAPGLSAAQVRRILLATADPVGDDPYAGGRNDALGAGRVNAARAVRAAALGLDQPDGAPCAEAVNCASGDCRKDPGAATGTCADAAPPGDAGPGTDPAGGPPDGSQTDAGPEPPLPADVASPEVDAPAPDAPPGDDPAPDAPGRRGTGGCRALPAAARPPGTAPAGLLAALAALAAAGARRRGSRRQHPP